MKMADRVTGDQGPISAGPWWRKGPWKPAFSRRGAGVRDQAAREARFSQEGSRRASYQRERQAWSVAEKTSSATNRPKGTSEKGSGSAWE